MSFLKDSAQALGIALSAGQLSRFAIYFSLLHFWNPKINLFAPAAPEEFLIKHFIDSLAPMKYYDMTGKTLVDIGTGAGFPAIPLGIASGLAKITMVDSARKKVSFLREAATALALPNVNIINERAEVYAEKHQSARNHKAVISAPTNQHYALDSHIKNTHDANSDGANFRKYEDYLLDEQGQFSPPFVQKANALTKQNPCLGYDIVISRAALHLPQLLDIASRLLLPNGVLLAMRGKHQEDVKSDNIVINRQQAINLINQHQYLLPVGGYARCLLVFARQD